MAQKRWKSADGFVRGMGGRDHEPPKQTAQPRLSDEEIRRRRAEADDRWRGVVDQPKAFDSRRRLGKGGRSPRFK